MISACTRVVLEEEVKGGLNEYVETDGIVEEVCLGMEDPEGGRHRCLDKILCFEKINQSYVLMARMICRLA